MKYFDVFEFFLMLHIKNRLAIFSSRLAYATTNTLSMYVKVSRIISKGIFYI